jgi:hypothetical protein
MSDKCFLNRGVTKTIRQCETIARWYCDLNSEREEKTKSITKEAIKTEIDTVGLKELTDRLEEIAKMLR